ncbi:MAG: hypothetical protein ACRD29_22070 [Acidimicrobiales bacterium]
MAAKQRRPTPEDRLEAIRIALSGIAGGADLADTQWDLMALHPKNNTFPGEVFLALAADALNEAGASRDNPIEYENIRETYLPEFEFHGRSDHRKSHFALRAAAMIHGGVSPDLLDEVIWWSSDDLWVFSLYALIAYVRIAAERTGEPVAIICERIARRHEVELSRSPS